MIAQPPPPFSFPQVIDKNWQTLGNVVLPPSPVARQVTLRCAAATQRDDTFQTPLQMPRAEGAELRVLLGDSPSALRFRPLNDACVLVEALPVAAGQAVYVASTEPGSHVVWATW